ncbi:MAG TPA: energy transducer TonB [Prolixibacteraceae bacterium]|nr:energy transducer TonB [Prolixibacteraceae bacterium]HPS11977.1 energy transducer TonB [Prolixibacteraceae bacterium]
MRKNFDINSPEWCDLVFEGKNKAYGAYDIRKLSKKRHLTALLIISFIFVFFLSMPGVIETVIPEKKERMVEVTSLADLKIEQNIPKEENLIAAPPPPPLKSSIKFTPPVITPDEVVEEKNEVKTQDELNEDKKLISVADVEGNDEENGVDIATIDENRAITQEESDEVFGIVEQMPEFPGGEIALYEWISNNIRYPKDAVDRGIKGKVYVNFVVDRNGNISNVHVVKSIHPSLDKEAIRVITSLPKWNPGLQGGKPVKVSYTLPINFTFN